MSNIRIVNKNEKKIRLGKIVEALKELYPESECALKYGGDPWRLLIMGRLSAQCTDARVNEVSLSLFEKYPTAEAMAEADISELEELIRPCGLYRMKARSIVDASKMLASDYGGVLPDTMDELLRLPGVGRKIANMLLGDIYKKPAVVCDTHCIRICGRLGFYTESLKDPVKIERLLLEIIDPAEGSDFCHRIVLFGRDICTARNSDCKCCPIAHLCERHQREETKG